VSGKDAKTGKFPPDADGQARLAFENLKQLLEAGGMGFGDVVKLTCFVGEESYREAINKYWLQYYPDAHHRPARHAIVTQMRGGALLQIEALAVARDA
jgi:2-iminobutanoate/2-iminopropanoate deaminase